MSSTVPYECVACGSRKTIISKDLDRYVLVKCNKCATIHYPDVKRDNITEEYHREETAEFYNNYYDSLRAFQAASILQVTRAFAPPPASLLDIGCGSGVFVQAALDMGYKAEGIDVSLPPNDHQHASGFLNKSSVFEFEGLPGCYDVVTVLNVLEHVSKPRPFLEAVSNLVKPGGVIVFALPLSTGLVYRTCRILYEISGGLISVPWKTITQWHLPYPHVFIPSIKGLQQMMQSVFSSSIISISPQVIVDGSKIGLRVDLERAQRGVGFLESLALYAAGSAFSKISNIASRLRCPDEVFFLLKNEKTKN